MGWYRRLQISQKVVPTSLAADCKTQLCKRHVLAASGINLIHQRTIAVERFAVLDFRRSLTLAIGPGGQTLYLAEHVVEADAPKSTAEWTSYTRLSNVTISNITMGNQILCGAKKWKNLHQNNCLSAGYRLL